MTEALDRHLQQRDDDYERQGEEDRAEMDDCPTSKKIRMPALSNTDPVLVSHSFLNAMADDVIQLEKELADYKKHFEPQMIQIQLLEKAHDEQALTFRRRG